MGKANQQITSETPFPIRTRIIATLVLLIGGAILIYSIYLFYQSQNIGYHEELFSFGAIASIIFGSIFFIPGLFILFKKRLSWWLAIILFFIITTIVTVVIIWNILYIMFWSTYKYYDIIDELLKCSIVIIPLIPFVILLRDRKNFFKIAS